MDSMVGNLIFWVQNDDPGDWKYWYPKDGERLSMKNLMIIANEVLDE